MSCIKLLPSTPFFFISPYAFAFEIGIEPIHYAGNKILKKRSLNKAVHMGPQSLSETRTQSFPL